MGDNNFTESFVAEDVIANLSGELGVSRTLARILACRGFHNVNDARHFLEANLNHLHDPFLLRDMEAAVSRILSALAVGEEICIYGDYDVDGAVSTALLMRFFTRIGAKVYYKIPNRVTEGYSLNKNAVDQIYDRGTRLIITVDNGIMAHEAIAYAHAKGMSIIVTDHHQVGNSLPDALAVINPQRKDCSYPFKGLCGAAVAFKLILALRLRLREKGFFNEKLREPNLKQELDLVSLATVCDCMALCDENRILVREGLKQLEQTKNIGLKALMEVSGVKKRATTTDLGFRLGPRLNACGRLDDASLGVRLLLTDSEIEATTLAAELDRLNGERQIIEAQMVEEALKMVETVGVGENGIVLFSPEWHVGVLGIVAARIAERTGRPTFVLALTEDGKVKGSGRSAGKVHLVKVLEKCAAMLSAFGGHEAAAGVTLFPEALEGFGKLFDEACREWMAQAHLPVISTVDAILTHEEITFRLCEELESLEPCGMGNQRPVFTTKNPVPVIEKRIVGEKHLKLKLGEAATLNGIAFRQGESLGKIANEIQPVFTIEKNEFRGKTSLQLIIQKIV